MPPPAPPVTPDRLGRLRQLVLGTDPAQRLRIGRSLMACAFIAATWPVTALSTALGLSEPAVAWAVCAYMACGVTTIYVLLRSGWNRRLAEPAMTLPQLAFAVSCIAVIYVGTPAVRSGVLVMFVPVMAFSLFSLNPAKAHGLAASSMLAFGILMLTLATRWPAIFDRRVELLNFLVLATALPTIATLAGQMSKLRGRLARQRAALQDALARLEHLARHDELTGLVNRRCMQQLLDAEAGRRASDRSPACLCMIDLDHFKRVNDRFGHAAGDDVLRRFARAAVTSQRRVDLFARWGGEEFLLLLPGVDRVEAVRAVARLRTDLAASDEWRDRPELRVTFSAGIARWRDGERAEQVIERADRAAYRAKADGRDRWFADSVPAVDPPAMDRAA